MKTRQLIFVIVLTGVLVGTLAVSAALVGRPVPAAAQAVDDDGEAEETEGQVAPAGTGITAAQARIIAQAAHPGTTVRAVEFEREGGHDHYEVELENGREVSINAASGRILGTERDDGD